MKFELDRLQDMEYDDDLTLVEHSITGHHRWSVTHKHVFKVESTGKFYVWYESRDATELQDSWDYDTHEECDEVFPVEKVVVVYE